MTGLYVGKRLGSGRDRYTEDIKIDLALSARTIRRRNTAERMITPIARRN
jgi:hypothetical protein